MPFDLRGMRPLDLGDGVLDGANLDQKFLLPIVVVVEICHKDFCVGNF
jgi:hypothetical protein